MQDQNPVFSIVMPTYNSERFVLEAAESVISQTFRSWELIGVDDASRDRTPSMLKQLENSDSRIKVILKESNGGPAEARNLAISNAVGRFIAFLDSDDIWRSDKLNVQLELFRQTGAPLVYSAYEKISEAGERFGRVIEVPDAIAYDQLLGAPVIATCTAAYDTKYVGRVLMPSIRKRQDFGLWLKILRHGGQARGVNEPLAFLRKRPGSVSSNKLSAALYTWKVYRDLEGMPLGQSIGCFAKYVVHAARKARI